MKRITLCAALIIGALFGTSASANEVLFRGTLITGNNGFLGNLAVDGTVDFSLQLFVPDGTDSSNITGTKITFDGISTETVTGGTATFTENGTDDNITFNFDTTGSGNGLGTFNFNGDFIADGTIDGTTLSSIIGSTTGFTFIDLGGVGVYTGNITAVPEPSGALVALGFVACAGLARRRRA